MDDQQNTQHDSEDSAVTQNTVSELNNNITTESAPELNKKMEAIMAMEGEEGRARREKEEMAKKEAAMLEETNKEKDTLTKQLKTISGEKEKLEFRWIDLSEKKQELQKLLEPILIKEANNEKDVQAKNQEEHATDDAKERQQFEKERQALEAEREKTEKEKWVIEDKIAELDKIMNENKEKYQQVLKDEYLVTDKIKNLDKKIESIKK